jgi:hypothetical protein
VRAVRILENLGDSRAIGIFIKVLDERGGKEAGDLNVESAIVEALGKSRDSRAVDALINYLVSRSKRMGMVDRETVRAIETVEGIGDPRAVRPLMDAARNLDGQAPLREGSWSDKLFLYVRKDALIDAEEPPERRRQPQAAFLETWRREDSAGVEKVARILRAERERILGPPIPSGPVSSVEEAVARLVAIYEVCPEGFVVGSGSKGEEEVRRVGKFLNEKGGFELMKQAHADFARRCRIRGAPRNVEFLWDGIGGWEG